MYVMKTSIAAFSPHQTLSRVKVLAIILKELSVVFLDIVNGRYNIDWTRYVQQVRNGKQCTRRNINTFTTRSLSKCKQESDFWLRATKLANLLGAHLGTCIEELEISQGDADEHL
ncbi:uncharacterized protein LOC142335250 [Convolutriloba macropyga]|uniref:uncharacterized protein LOC142335250 n=1 Tax=Convolutriloba macropyga TaxID=536237 RepID=UPI003F51C3BA